HVMVDPRLRPTELGERLVTPAQARGLYVTAPGRGARGTSQCALSMCGLAFRRAGQELRDVAVPERHDYAAKSSFTCHSRAPRRSCARRTSSTSIGETVLRRGRRASRMAMHS